MKRKQTLSLLLLAAMLATTACGGGSNDTPSNDTTPQDGSDTTPVVEGYDYQGKDFNNYEFKVLNLDEQYGCYVRLDFEEQTGEQLDDAVYDRNRKVEDKLNIQFKEVVLAGGAAWETGQIAACDAVIQAVMADENDEFDAAYLPVYFKPDVVTGGYLVNLLDVPEMNVYADYWDAKINTELTVNDTLFIAASPLHFMTLDLCWLYLFNEDMMDNLQLEYPYQLVRDGKWTLDKLNEYISVAANLNGDESFKFDLDGNSVYGISAHTALHLTQRYACNDRTYTRDSNGDIQLTLESEHFYNVLDKVAKMLTMSDGRVYYNNTDLPDLSGYVGVFSVDRALFLDCQLKAAQGLRHMESSYGMVPKPKFDEAQEDYHVNVGDSACFLSIPVTNDNLSRTGFILDALSYESHKDVLPVYMDVTVSQKGLRNDDSIEMLEYIWEDRSIDMTGVYRITKDCVNAIGKLVQAGTGDVSSASSVVASHLPAAEQKLLEFLDAIESAKNN